MTILLDFGFREKLDSMIGGKYHCFCFQCGACVGDCPTARYSEEFNPRVIMLKTIFGQEEELIQENSVIWSCTNCYNCYERCPQDVRPVEVIIALKNLARRKGKAPDEVQRIVDSVGKTGRTVVVTRTSINRREEFGLPPLSEVPMEEIQRLLKAKNQSFP